MRVVYQSIGLPTIFGGVISIIDLILFKINSKLSRFILICFLNLSFEQFRYQIDQYVFCSLLFQFAVFYFFWLFYIYYFHDALTYCYSDFILMVPTKEKNLVMFNIFFQLPFAFPSFSHQKILKKIPC